MLLNKLLIEQIASQYGIHLSEEIIIIISNLSITPICSYNIYRRKKFMNLLLIDIKILDKIYTYDFNSCGDLNHEYKYNNKISRHCHKVSPLNDFNHNINDVFDKYGIHHRFDVCDEVNWCGIKIINHFRKINPINYRSHQITNGVITNNDSRIIYNKINKDVIPRVLVARNSNFQDFQSRLALPCINVFHSSIGLGRFTSYESFVQNSFKLMKIEDEYCASNFWNRCKSNNVGLLWRPLYDMDVDEISSIELIIL